MALNGKIYFALLFAMFWCYGSSFMCQKLDNQLQQLCSTMNGGYNFTAMFQSVNGSSYQDRVYSKVLNLQRALKTCSNVSQLMICSSFIPKCVEGRSSPVLPCREICEQFVDQCESKLEERNLRVLYETMCREFPDGQESAGECIKPKGFEKQEKKAKLGISFNCSTQSIPACLHKNYSQLPKDIKIKLIKRLGPSEPLIKSGCSEQLTRYSCYGQTTPCYIHGRYPYRPCRWFCEFLKKECDREISLFKLLFALCDELTERDRVGDLCRMNSWPVPWPNITKREEVKQKLWKTCTCDNCGQMKRTFETNGSCFIQNLINIHGTIHSQRTCLEPGKKRDFICNSTKNYLYAKCCDQDHCNKNLQWMSKASTTTAKPTSIPMTTVTNYTSTTVRSTSNSAITYNITTKAKPTSIPMTTAVTNFTSTRTTPPSIVATTHNSSSTSTGHDGIYIITIKTALTSVLAITLKH